MTEAERVEPDALTGVVSPPDEYDIEVEPDEGLSPYERAKREAEDALTLTRERLTDLRKSREGINAEIKQLVAEEDLLDRMTRVRKSPKG